MITKTRIKKFLLTCLALLIIITLFMVIRKPWSITTLREGFPSQTWPASGNSTSQGNTDAVAIEQNNKLIATTEFLDSFKESEGAAIGVAKDGEIIYTYFAEGFSKDTKFNTYSMAKSLTGVLILKAISDGDIPSLDSTVDQFWSETKTTEIGDLQIHELLNMKSGIAFEKESGDVGHENETGKKDTALEFGPFSNLARLHVNGVDSVLSDIKVIEKDRGKYSYQNLNTAILGRVLEETYDTPLDEQLYNKLAKPADAGGFHWRQYSSAETPSAYCCIYANLEWWLKVTNFIMTNGENNSFLSSNMHEYFLGNDLKTSQITEGVYRSQTRYDILDREGEKQQGPFLFFTGNGGQMAYMIPHTNEVIVRFGSNYQPLHTTLYQISDFVPK